MIDEQANLAPRLTSPIVMLDELYKTFRLSQMAGKAISPAKGWKRNPLLGLQRNMACPCKSGKKWKVCCMPLTRAYIPEPFFEEYAYAHRAAERGDWAWD